MALPPVLRSLSLPVIAAPMFIVSNPELVIAQCRGGVVGSFPALNARPKEELDAWLSRIRGALGPDDAPFAVNIAGLPLSPGRYEWQVEIDQTLVGRVPFTVMES